MLSIILLNYFSIQVQSCLFYPKSGSREFNRYLFHGQIIPSNLINFKKQITSITTFLRFQIMNLYSPTNIVTLSMS